MSEVPLQRTLAWLQSILWDAGARLMPTALLERGIATVERIGTK